MEVKSMTTRFLAVTTAFLAFVAVGCGSQPIPTLIVEGTTGTITLPPNIVVGFGRAFAGDEDFTLMDPVAGPVPAPGVVGAYGTTGREEDLQRGEMILGLFDESGNEINRLPVKFITRVNAHPSSDYMNEDFGLSGSQVVVVFDIPDDLVTDAQQVRDLSIRVERYRRSMSLANHEFVQVPVYKGTENPYTTFWNIGWGGVSGPLSARIPITIADDPRPDGFEPGQVGPLRYTEREGWGIKMTCPAGLGTCGWTMDTTPTFDSLATDYTPNPEFYAVFDVTDPQFLPAASEFTLEYPADKMSIVGVSLFRQKSSEAYLDWDAPTLPSMSCDSAVGELDIRIVDPDQLTHGVVVAFKRINETIAACESLVTSTNINLLSGAQAYDVDGDAISFPPMNRIMQGEL
jgi:hypothetical protein